MLGAIGGGVAFYLQRSDDGSLAKSVVTTDEWADQYCEAFEPYNSEGSTLYNSIAAGLATSDLGTQASADQLKDSILKFGEIAQKFLVDLEVLAETRTIAGGAGETFGNDVLDGVSAAQTKVTATVEAIGELDTSNADFGETALSTVLKNGLTFNSKVKVARSAVLDEVNAAIGGRGGCLSVLDSD